MQGPASSFVPHAAQAAYVGVPAALGDGHETTIVTVYVDVGGVDVAPSRDWAWQEPRATSGPRPGATARRNSRFGGVGTV